MAKLSRVKQYIFGSNAGSNQLAEIGSTAAGSTTYVSTSQQLLMQTGSLANFLAGWYACVIGQNSPTITDMNSLFNLITYQLSYGFQSGIPEYDSTTTYYTGSYCSSAGVMYVSQIDNNTGNSLSDTTKWKSFNPVLAAGAVYVGDSNGVAQPVALGGDGTISAAGGPPATTGLLALSGSSFITNASLVSSVAANALTIALKTAAGTNASATSPVGINFDSSTGGFNRRTVTGALSITVPNGATLGTSVGNPGYLYIYALDNSGTAELAISSSLFDEGSVQTTTTISSTASSRTTLYSTTGRANVAVRLIGRGHIASGPSGGAWSVNLDEVSLRPFQDPHSSYASTILNPSFTRNFIINSGFDVWQFGTSTACGATLSVYFADQWYLKVAGANPFQVTASRQTGTFGKYAAKAVVAQASNGSGNAFEMTTVLENPDSILLYNKSVSFSAQVLAFGNVTQVGIQFLSATSETKPSTTIGSETLVSVNSGSYTLATLVNQALGTGMTTSGIIGVRIRPTAVSSGNIWDLGNGIQVEQTMLNLGGVLAPYSRAGVTMADEILLCQRFYCKTFAIDTAPAQNAGSVGALEGVGAAANQRFTVNWQLPVEMRSSAPSTTTYSTNAASANWSTNGTTPTAVVNSVGPRNLSVQGNTSVGAGTSYLIHVSADARI